MDILADRPDTIFIEMRNIQINQKVIYENIPCYCTKCRHLGHDIKGYKWNKQEEDIIDAKRNDPEGENQYKDLESVPQKDNIQQHKGDAESQKDKTPNILNQKDSEKALVGESNTNIKGKEMEHRETKERSSKKKNNNRSRKKKRNNNKSKEVMHFDDLHTNLLDDNFTKDEEKSDEDGAAIPLWEKALTPRPNPCSGSNFEILANLKDPQISYLREEFLSEPDIRASGAEEDEDHNFIIKDGQYQALSKQSRDDCPTSKGRYSIRSRRKKRDLTTILMIKLLIWNIRGIRHPSRVKFLNSYCRDYQPDICAIPEP